MILPACKKGEDDPGLSFRSRDARITGEWLLLKSDDNTASNNVKRNLEDNTIETTVTQYDVHFDGNTYHHTFSLTIDNVPIIDPDPITDTINYRYTYFFHENGDFLKEERRTHPDGRIVTVNNHGNWSWGNNTKNKIAVDISIDGSVEHFVLPELSNNSMRFEHKTHTTEKYKINRSNPHEDDYHEHRTIDNSQFMTFKKL